MMLFRSLLPETSKARFVLLAWNINVLFSSLRSYSSDYNIRTNRMLPMDDYAIIASDVQCEKQGYVGGLSYSCA
jgi:hypothetical protein